MDVPEDVKQVRDLESQHKQNHASAKNDRLSILGDYLAGRIIGLRGAGQKPPQRTDFLQVGLENSRLPMLCWMTLICGQMQLPPDLNRDKLAWPGELFLLLISASRKGCIEKLYCSPS